MVKKYWDLFSGTIMALVLCIVARFKLEKVQLCYSIIILILVSIGFFKIVKQSVEKRVQAKEKDREHNLIDDMVDRQGALKAISLAQNPTNEGEKVGKFLIELWEVNRKIMKKFKELFDKYKGYLLTVLLGVLTAIENYGGFINELCGGVLVINGVEVLPLVTLIAALVVGVLSDPYTKDKRSQIKALLSKPHSNSNVLVRTKIKEIIKSNTAEHAQLNKDLATQEAELGNYESELEKAKNNLQATDKMYKMTPQLATAEEVNLAANAVTEIENKISEKQAEIESTKEAIESLATQIKALKSQLQVQGGN